MTLAHETPAQADVGAHAHAQPSPHTHTASRGIHVVDVVSPAFETVGQFWRKDPACEMMMMKPGGRKRQGNRPR